MWDLPRPGLEPVSSALAGGFLTTAPPGKSLSCILVLFSLSFLCLVGLCLSHTCTRVKLWVMLSLKIHSLLIWERCLLFKRWFLRHVVVIVILRVVFCHKMQSKLIVKSCLFCLQGTRVWLRENGQHFPSTVNSCAEGIVVFRTDYGQVSRVPAASRHPCSASSGGAT